MRRSHWRDSKEWSQSGMPLSTTSDEACKLYDGSLSQYTGWYDDQSLGGLENSLKKMKEADPHFVLGSALALGLELIGTGTSLQKEDSDLQFSIRGLVDEAKRQGVSEWEMGHVKALQSWSQGNLDEAISHWEEILLFHPKDMHAIKMLQDTYFYLGKQTEMRDSIGRVLPEWDTKDPLQSYLYGMYAFGLVETNRFSEAEEMAQLGLSRNPEDAWATHALTHVHEMTGEYEKGLQLLERTRGDWAGSNYLQNHIYWHWGLFNMEINQPEVALELFQSHICPSAVSSGGMLDFVDASSLLYRLQLQDVDVSGHWAPLCRIAEKHKDDHVLLFNDAHFLMTFLGNGEDELGTQFSNNYKQLIKSGKWNKSGVDEELGPSLLESIIAYHRKEYTEAANLLNSIKYKIVQVGGSNAQRDLFNLLLLNASVRSGTPYHLALAKSLINERKAKRRNSPLTDRILEQLISRQKSS